MHYLNIIITLVRESLFLGLLGFKTQGLIPKSFSKSLLYDIWKFKMTRSYANLHPKSKPIEVGVK